MPKAEIPQLMFISPRNTFRCSLSINSLRVTIAAISPTPYARPTKNTPIENPKIYGYKYNKPPSANIKISWQMISIGLRPKVSLK